jgi:hypothetical protein
MTFRRCCDTPSAKGTKHLPGCPSIKAIADNLMPSERKGLCATPGSGDFNRATFDRLVEKGLIDWRDYGPTELGWQIREHLGVKN